MTLKETDFSFPGQTDFYRGKVRDVYTITNDTLVSVATDRISAFDVVFERPIPYKGQVLNQIAAHFLQSTSDIAPNWLREVPDPNVSIGKKCKPFKIEMVIRSALVGHAWRTYDSGSRELCGVKLPDGLREYDLFDEAIMTPSTKAHEGHDEDISAEEIIDRGLATREEWDELCRLTRALFTRGQQHAQTQNLLLADTKYEFGKSDGKIYVIDEIHTPDSSRYFYADSYEAFLKDRTSEKPRNLSKEFVRQWLIDHGFSGQAGQVMPKMDDEFIDSVSKRYIELYEQLTGQEFIYPDPSADPIKRIEQSVMSYLGKD